MTAPRRTLEGHVVVPGGLLRGQVVVERTHIAAVQGTPVPDTAWRGSALPLIVPGFVDLHVHGGGGADTMQAADDPGRIGPSPAPSITATTGLAAPAHARSISSAAAPISCASGGAWITSTASIPAWASAAVTAPW